MNTPFKRIQWKHFWNRQKFTPAHLYDPKGRSERGWRKTLCGKSFFVEYGASWTPPEEAQKCKRCWKIAAKGGNP